MRSNFPISCPIGMPHPKHKLKNFINLCYAYHGVMFQSKNKEIKVEVYYSMQNVVCQLQCSSNIHGHEKLVVSIGTRYRSKRNLC